MRLRLSSTVWLPVCVFVCAFAVAPRVVAADGDVLPTVLDADASRIQHVVDDLKSRLSIPQTVRVSVVAHEPLMASVGPDPASTGAFVMSFEEAFLNSLDDDELAAAVAHELGHVWIFTHFPYLQTEQLANEIAMRVVSRDSLVPIYAQVFERTRVDGDLKKYLGDPQPDR